MNVSKAEAESYANESEKEEPNEKRKKADCCFLNLPGRRKKGENRKGHGCLISGSRERSNLNRDIAPEKRNPTKNESFADSQIARP